MAELDGNVYITLYQSEGGLSYPSITKQWSSLPALPCIQFTLVTQAILTLKQLLAISGLSDFGSIASDRVFAWEGEKWVSPYPNMPTTCFHSSAVYYQSKVIVAGNVIKKYHPDL